LALNGNDSLNNNAEKVSIDAGANDDFISNTGKRTTLTGQSGSDTINNNAGNVLAIGGKGNDSIFNHGEAVSISGVEGSNLIENYTNSNEVSIMGGAEADSIQNRSSKSTISGENGSDTILSNGNSNSILGGADSDLISLQGAYKNTIIGGAGSDTINLDWSSNEALIQYSKGDGFDIIEGFNATSTLQIGDGNETYSKAIEGEDIIITVGGEKITVKGGAKLDKFNIAGVTRVNVNNTENATAIFGDRLEDSIKNSGIRVTVNALSGSDTVENTGSRTIIDAGDDSDLITNTNGKFVTIKAGAGADKISVSGGEKNIISGNAGNDSIYIAPTETELLIQYKSGDGNDIIYGFNENSTLQLGDGTSTYAQTAEGNDIIITNADGQITLSGAATLPAVNIAGRIPKGIVVNNISPNTLISGTNGNDSIQNGGANVTIKAHAGNDSISNIESESVTIDSGAGDDYIYSGYNLRKPQLKYSNFTSINGGKGDDTIFNTSDFVTIDSGAGNDSIKNGGGKLRDKNLLIFGSDGNDTIENVNSPQNFTIEGGKGDDFILNPGYNALVKYSSGDGSDYISGFSSSSTLSISGAGYTTAKSGSDIIVTVDEGKITLAGAARARRLNIIKDIKENPLIIENTDSNTLLAGTSLDDNITNSGSYVTISALGGSDSIINDTGYFSSIAGGDGNDLISVASGSQVTINADKADDTINLSDSDETFIEYNAGDGNDVIYGFDDMATLNIAKTEFTSATTGNNIIITVGTNKITLEGAATLSNPHIINGTQATFTVKNGAVTCESDLPKSVIKEAYQFNTANSLLTLNDKLQNYTVNVKADDAGKVKWHYGTANLVSGSTLEYKLDEGKNTATLTSKNYGDKITFDENASFNFGRIKAEIFGNGTVSTKSDQAISFENNSSASVKAPRNYQIGVTESNITVNDLPINAISGAGTVTVNDGGMSFEGYGVQFADLEVAKESYFGKFAPMTVAYNSADKTYTLYNTACVKTLSNDFTKLTFNFSGNNDEKYAYYKINNLAISTVKKDISGVEVSGNKFKIQGKEIDAENIGRITLDEQITFSGTEINFDGVKVNYTHNKPVIYSLDGKEITLNDAASLTTGDETKTFKCEAGSYTVNGRSFETSAPLTFSADTKEIRIPLSDAATEIYFDGVKVSGISGRELVFDSDKVTIPTGASINIISPNAVNLNLAAGDYTIDGKKVLSTGGVKTSAEIGGNGLPADSITTTESGEFSIHGRQYKISDDRDGVTFLTDSRGMVSEIKGLEGSVEGNFENAIRVNGKIFCVI